MDTCEHMWTRYKKLDAIHFISFVRAFVRNYCSITEFRVECLTYAHKPRTAGPLADFAWLRPATNRNHTRQEARKHQVVQY